MATFSLEKAIQAWLKAFQKHQAFDEGNLQEVEVHLRDHIDDLVGEGYSEQEAFDKAVKDFGDQREVAKEEYWNQERKPSIRKWLFSAMLKNYYRTSIRAMLRNPMTTFINVFGLAVAIGSAMVVYSFYEFDASIDQFHENKHEVFLATNYVNREGKLAQYGTSPAPLGIRMSAEMPGISAMSRILDARAVVKSGEEVYHQTIRMADEDFLDMFTFPLEKGSKDALNDPSQVIISSEMATKFFGETDAIGKDLKVIFSNGQNRVFLVGGVAAPFPKERTISFDFLVNFEITAVANEQFDPNSWSNEIAATFIQLEEPKAISSISTLMEEYKTSQVAANPDWPIESFDFVSLADLHQRSRFIEDDISHDTNAEARLGLPIIAGLMMILACLNYVNIAMTNAVKRLKEIGLRKVIGANRYQLVMQFLSENVVMTLFALTFGLLLAWMVFIPWFISLSGDPLKLNLLDPYLWLFSAAMVLCTGIISGLYPAIYISRYQSVQIFDGRLRFGRKSLLTKVFLALQLIITCGSITCAIIFTQNNVYQHQRDWGYDKQMTVFAKTADHSGAVQLQNALTQSSDVLMTTLSKHHIGENYETAIVHFPDREYEVARLEVDENYLSVMGIDLLSGRDFVADAASDQFSVIVNQTLVEQLVLAEPIGTEFKLNDQRFTIVGVMQDIHSYNFYHVIKPMMFTLASEDEIRYVTLRTNESRRAEVYTQLQDNWLALFPETPFQGAHQEDTWTGFFHQLSTAERFYKALAIIAILLAGMGLYGLVTLNVTSRVREFSIRKVLGAELAHLANSVGGQYVLLFLVSLVVGIPFSYWLAVAAMEMLYAYPMPMTVSGLVIAVFIMIFILFLVVSSQIRNVLRANPASGLRTE